MDIILYITVFLIGIFFGSFYTLAAYRIPKKQDILHTHSYCPNCDHKLGFLDLFPLFSYIFLKGRCRYCKEKIRPRYFILEFISGIFFVVVAFLLGIRVETLTVYRIAEFSFLILYFTFVILMASIDYDNRKINKPVLSYGIILSIIYIVYLCVIEKNSIYRYGIYLIFDVILLILDTITLKKRATNRYVYSILLTLIVMAIFTGEYVTFNTILITLLAIAIYILLEKLKNKMRKSKKADIEFAKQISIGFYLAIANISNFIFVLILNNYMLQ